jgi:hypothetical protein
MPEDLQLLISDTLNYLKSCDQQKPWFFANFNDWAFFQSRQVSKPYADIQAQENLAPLRQQLSNFSPSYKQIDSTISATQEKTSSPGIAKTDLLPASKKDRPISDHKTPPKLAKTEEMVATLKDESASFSPIKKTLERVAPHLKLIDQIPDDSEAKRILSAWKEKITDVEVILIACDTQTDTLELLKGLAKAIDQNLAKSKVITANRLEQEKKWDLFLKQNQFRLVIISEGFQKFPELMRHYKAIPANAKFFLDQIPLLVLSSTSSYKSLEHKALLWKTLCQILKK